VNLSLAILVVYGLVFLLSMLVTFVTFIIFLCEKKPRESEACGNTLIVSATICAVVGYLSIPVIDYLSSRGDLPDMPSNPMSMAATAKADMAANGMIKAEAGDVFVVHYPMLPKVPVYLGLATKEKARAAVQKFFEKLPVKDKETTGIAARQAIFDHETGKTPGNELSKLIAEASQEEVQLALKQYLKVETDEDLKEHMSETLSKRSEECIEKDELKFLTLIKNIDKPLAPGKLTEAIATVEKQLPDGWYRYSLLRSLYKAAGADDLLRAQDKIHDDNLLARMHRMLTGCALIILWLICGIASGIALFFHLRKNEPLPEFDNPLADNSLKIIYSQTLAICYVQFMFGVIYGIIAMPSLGLGPVLKEFALVSTLLTFSGNILLLLITTQIMLCKPLGLNAKEVLPKLFPSRWRSALVWSVGGFCLTRSIVFSLILAAMLFFNHNSASSNPFDHQIIAATIDAKPVDIALLWFSGAILGPLYEEIVFRGIFYAALRKHLGASRAVILSAAIFGACHLDPNLFLSHFVVGIGLATIYERTRSLFPCFLTHMLWNTSVMLMAWLMI